MALHVLHMYMRKSRVDNYHICTDIWGGRLGEGWNGKYLYVFFSQLFDMRQGKGDAAGGVVGEVGMMRVWRCVVCMRTYCTGLEAAPF